MLSRRQFVRGVSASGAVAAGLAVVAGCIGPLAGDHPPPPMRRVGVLWTTASDEVTTTRFEVFRAALRAGGYAEGQNVLFESRFTDGYDAQTPGLAAELVALPVDVILAAGGQAGRAASNATRTLPIVQVAGNPVDEGKAATYARPGGNLTGLASDSEGMLGKRLQLLKETLPALTRVAVLLNDAQPTAAAMTTETQRAADAL